ncbi:MAG: hypothetical protein KDL87_08345, partial [Verrucomicrobiae bacterium]|nr:hypothetical protein [Verrucomicrobiae bacterium]
MFFGIKRIFLPLLFAASASSASAAMDLFSDDFQDDSIGTPPAITGSNVGDSFSPVAGSITVGANPETNGNTSSQVLRGGGVAANQNQIHAFFDGGSTSIAGITVAFDFYVSSSAGNSSDGVRFGLYNEAGNNNGYYWRFDRVGASIGYLNTATGNTHAGSDIWQRFSVTYAAGGAAGTYDLAWSVTNLETGSVVASGTIPGTNAFADGLAAGLILEVNDTNNGNDFLGYIDNVLVTAPEPTS